PPTAARARGSRGARLALRTAAGGGHGRGRQAWSDRRCRVFRDARAGRRRDHRTGPGRARAPGSTLGRAQGRGGGGGRAGSELPETATTDALIAAMQLDKKSREGTVRFALPRAIGRMYADGQSWTVAAPEQVVRKVLAGS